MNPETIFNSADPLDLYYYQLLDYLQGEISEGRMTAVHAGQVIAEAQTLVNNAYRAAADNNIPIETGLENLLASLPYYDDVKTATGTSTRAFGDYLTRLLNK